MPSVDQVREKMYQVFSDNFEDVTVTEDGVVVFRAESTICLIDVIEWDPKIEGRNTLISLDASIVTDVKRSKALYEWVALSNDDFVFGHIVVRESDDKSLANIWFTHNILGDNFHADELLVATLSLLQTADQLDDEVMHTFGGTRMYNE